MKERAVYSLPSLRFIILIIQNYKYISRSSKDYDYTILQNPEYNLTPEYTELMKNYLIEYKEFKKRLRHDLDSSYSNIDSFIHHLRKECNYNISNNESELANYAIEITYNGDKSMLEFAWKMFPDGILENIITQSSGIISMPVQDVTEK